MKPAATSVSRCAGECCPRQHIISQRPHASQGPDNFALRSRHPELCAYIDGAVRDLADLLRRGEAERLAILVLGAPLAQSSAAPSDVLVVPNVLETFVLELSGAPAAISGVHKLLEQLRGFLVRVCVCEQQLTPLAPEELSFSLEVHTVHAPSEELCQRWVSCSRSEAGTGPSRIVPLKSMVAEEAGFDMRLLVAQRQP